MRVRSIVDEAVRDLTSGTSRAPLFAILFAAIVIASSIVALSDPLRGLRAAADYRASGASISVLRAEGRIDASACDALENVTGVRAAGALRKADSDVVPAALPSGPIPTKVASPAFLRLVDPTGASTGSGVVVTKAVLQSLGRPEATTLPLQDGTVRIASVFDYPEDGRQGDLAYAVLVPEARGDPRPYDECWADVWPQSTAATALLRTTVLTSADENAERPTLFQLNGKHGATFDDHAPSGLGSGVAANVGALLVGLLLGWTVVRLRRLELASARHAGVSRWAQTLGHTWQALAWMATGSILASPVLVWLTRDGDPSAQFALVATAFRPLLVAGLATLAGVIAASASTRERHLFRYFKGR